MRTIVVDDEPLMLSRFRRLSEDIPDLEICGMFRDPSEALDFMRDHEADLAFLDIGMPIMNGIELAQNLRSIRPDILIVFITAYDDYIREANRIGSDAYIVKPYGKEVLLKVTDNMRLLSKRQEKPIFIKTFGKFNVFVKGKPLPLRGKAKEILALVVVQHGNEISNEKIYSTLWEEREYSHDGMKVYFNALRRLKDVLAQEGIEAILLSTAHGQMADTSRFDCDYYDLLEQKTVKRDALQGMFLEDYSWGEGVKADILSI